MSMMTLEERAYRRGALKAMRIAYKLCEQPYGDAVQVIGRQEPSAVGKKLGIAIVRAVDKYLREREGR